MNKTYKHNYTGETSTEGANINFAATYLINIEIVIRISAPNYNTFTYRFGRIEFPRLHRAC